MTSSRTFHLWFFVVAALLIAGGTVRAGDPVIIDHNCTDLPLVPSAWIDQAKADLHIAYGHTSHGSQITDGMTGLVGFTGGCGGPQFAWNNGGTGGALDLHDYAMGGDCGYYPQWVINTRNYLDDPNHADVNVIIWSWCGQHSGYSEQDMIDKYLAPMEQLEQDYPHVMFVYMTGHVNYWQKQNTDARNQQIRDWCMEKGKILFDFADIESWNPDNLYFPYVNDDCSYWDGSGNYLGNWAEEWQNTHVKDVEWYDCYCAHSKPLNGNQKAYAAWWLWTRLAGWTGPGALYVDGDDTLSAAAGGRINLCLEAGKANKGRHYLVLGSISGTSPGTQLPGGLVLPLNWDAFTDLVIGLANTSLFPGFSGTLDEAGRANAQVVSGPIPSSAVGVTLYFAYCLNNPFDFVSGAVSVQVEP